MIVACQLEVLGCDLNSHSAYATAYIYIYRIGLLEQLIRKVEKCETNLDVRKVGVEFEIQQSKKLLSSVMPVLYYYSMGKSDNIHK